MGQRVASLKGKLVCESGAAGGTRGPSRASWGQHSGRSPSTCCNRPGAAHSEAVSGRRSSHCPNSGMGPDSWWRSCLQHSLLKELAAASAWHDPGLHHPFLHKQAKP